MPGNVSRRTDETAKIICETIEIGATRRRASAYAGISEHTLMRWEKADAQFAQRLKAAEAKRDRSLILEIRQAARTDWRAASWLLERVAREDYGTPKLDVNLTVRQVHERAEKIAADLGMTVEDVLAEAEAIVAGTGARS